MATEFKLNYTATQVNEKLGQIENKANKDWVEEQIEALDFVSEEQATEITQAAIKNIKIGGRNLLKNSKGGFVVFPQDAAFASYPFFFVPTLGETYTFSADVEITDGNFDKISVYPYPGGTLVNVLIPTNRRIIHTFTANVDTITQILAYAGVAGETNGNGVIFRNVKIEKGNKATDWTPALEDTESAIAAVSNAIDNIKIGGRNLLLNSGREITNNLYTVASYEPVTPLVPGETYTFSLCITPGSGMTHIAPYVSDGNASPFNFYPSGTQKQILTKTFAMCEYYPGKTPEDNISNAKVRMVRFPDDGTTGNTTIHWIKIEKGNKPTDWTPAPEDFEEDITSINNKIAPMEEKLAGLNNSNIINGAATGSLRTINSAVESSTYSLGNYAFTEGYNTKASGQYSHAEGYGTEASSSSAHAEGNSTIASGLYSHAEGSSTRASATYGHAEGYSTQATGAQSHAQGSSTIAAGQCSFVAGLQSTAKGDFSNAIGGYLLANEAYETIIGKYNIGTNVATNTIATTNVTYTFNTSASYTCSTTAPTVNLANGTITWTNTSTKRPYQFSTNNYVKITDTSYGKITGSSTTSGSQIKFPMERKTLQLATTKLSPYAFIVGNGTTTSLRSNAHTLDWDGNAWYSGEVYVGGTNKDSGTKLAHQPKILEVSVPSTSLETGTNYSLGIKILYPDDVIEIKPDYTKDTSAGYREAIRKANFGSKFEKIYQYDDGRADYNFYVIPDGEIDSSISTYYFLVINHGPGGAW